MNVPISHKAKYTNANRDDAQCGSNDHENVSHKHKADLYTQSMGKMCFFSIIIHNRNLVITLDSCCSGTGITDMMAFSSRSFLVETIIFTEKSKSNRN